MQANPLLRQRFLLILTAGIIAALFLITDPAAAQEIPNSAEIVRLRTDLLERYKSAGVDERAQILVELQALRMISETREIVENARASAEPNRSEPTPPASDPALDAAIESIRNLVRTATTAARIAELLLNGTLLGGGSDPNATAAPPEVRPNGVGLGTEAGRRVDDLPVTAAGPTDPSTPDARVAFPDPNERPFRTRARDGSQATPAQVATAFPRLIDGRPAKEMNAQEAFRELDRIGVAYKKLRGPRSGISDPVRLQFPLLGVEFPYVHRTRRGVPRVLLKRSGMTVDARNAVAITHTVQQVQAMGRQVGLELVRINHIGAHVTHKGGQHPRGQALDYHSFVFRDRAGKEVLVSLWRDWTTARSSRKKHKGRVEIQTAAERAGMTGRERFLRQIWGFMRTEYDLVVTPSHNPGHHNHFHSGLRNTPRQERRSRPFIRRAAKQRATRQPGHTH